MKKFFYKYFEIQGICLDIVLVIAVVFFVVISIGQHPFRKDVTVDNVERITIDSVNVAYDFDEYELPKDSEYYLMAIDCMQNIKTAMPRIDNTPIFGGFGYIITAYLKSGEIRTVKLLSAHTTFGKEYAYISVDSDEKQYIADIDSALAICDVVEPYRRGFTELYE